VKKLEMLQKWGENFESVWGCYL